MSDSQIADLSEMLITDALSRRRDRPILSTFTNAVMAELDRLLDVAPEQYVEEVARAAMILPGAQSGGVSVLDAASGACRTRAVLGSWEKHRGSCVLLDEVLCPLALEHKMLLAIAHPQRGFRQLEAVYPPVVEILMMPFFSGARPAGVVWSVFHQGDAPFDRHDAYMVEELGRVLTAAHSRLSALGLI